MAEAGNTTGAGGPKNIKRATRKHPVRKKPPGPPNFPTKVPVRPGAPTNRYASKPTTQAQRTHVHEARRRRAEDVEHAQAEHDIVTDKDLAIAQKFNEAHPVKHEGLTIDTSTPEGRDLLAKGRKNLAKAQQGGALGELTGLNIKKALNNVPSNAVELAATTPTSVYMLGKTAVTEPTKVPGMLAQPYKDLIKDPKGFIEEQPVSAALMVAPVGKAPGLAAGKALRVAGKQTLKGETRTLPGTALKQTTRRSKDAFKNVQQARQERSRPTPSITDKEVRRRVDEHFEYRRKYVKRVEASAGKEAGRRFEGMPKAERKAATEEHVSGARGGAGVQNDRTFAKEFGSTWRMGEIPHPESVKPGTAEFKKASARYDRVRNLRDRPGTKGEASAAQAAADRVMGGAGLKATAEGIKPRTLKAILKPKKATEGHLHANRADAVKVAERLKAAGHGDFEVQKVSDNEFGVVPTTASNYFEKHKSVGTAQATYAKVLRASRQKFTNAVLPTSPKWLAGQVGEGTLRANIHAGGPVGVATGLIRERKVFKALEKERPGAGKEFRSRALPGGHYGGQVQEFRTTKLHEIFNEADDGKIGDVLAKVGRAGEKAPGAKRIVNGWNRYTRTVFDQVNGRLIENPQQRAMLGRSLKDSPLMERRILGLSNKAAAEAAKGLRGTEAQVEFGRAVERAYGKYSNFSPSQRERNLHWTPFLPWYANALKFLTQVLPKDHPVLTSLLAAGNVATQKEREKAGLSTKGKNAKPLFMQGGIPTKSGGVVRIGHYTPFSLGSTPPLESAASLVLPQFTGTLKNMVGIDWKNEQLKRGGPHGRPFTQTELAARAAATQAEALIPGAGQVARITGAEDRLSGKDTPTILSGKDLAAALRKEVDPLMATKSGSDAKSSGPAVKVAPVRVKPIRVKPVRVKPVR